MMSNNIDVLTAIVKEAGVYMKGAVSDGVYTTEKSNVKDFVTVADIKTQNIIAKRLCEHFPSAIILSEEDSEETQAAMYEPDFTGFVLDPIDGTYNFKRDMRESAISIGHINGGEADFGVIYDPYKDELFSAEKKGKGAFRNNKPIQVSGQTGLEGANIAISNSYDDAAMERNLRRHLSIYEQIGSMPWTSCAGSGVLIMTNIACGRVDTYHHNGLKPWDNAAAFLLVNEAGGVVTSLRGEPVGFTANAVIIGSKAVTKELLSIFSKLPNQELLS